MEVIARAEVGVREKVRGKENENYKKVQVFVVLTKCVISTECSNYNREIISLQG